MNEVSSAVALGGASVAAWSESAVSSGAGAVAADFARVLLEQRGKQGGSVARSENQEKPAPSAAEVAAARAAARQALHAQAVKDLKEYLEKSPAEHLREAVLREMGLSEEDLAKMPPEERKATEMEIGRRVREHLLGRKPKDSEQEASLAALNARPVASANDAEAAQAQTGSLAQAMAVVDVAEQGA